MTEILRIEGLHKHYGALEVLRGIDLTVARGEVVVVLGASGSGKSTLLRCVNLLETPSRGRLVLDGLELGETAPGARYPRGRLCALRAKIGMVFQQFNLFPHLSVEWNVMIGPMRVHGLNETAARQLAHANLAKMGIPEKAQAYPSHLSGGQQQRVAIARALAMEPAVMLFDEATSALDPELVGEVLLAMRRLRDEHMTMLVVTHELGFAYHIADRIVFLHEGQVYEQGPPDQVLLSPKRERTREFLRSHTMFRMPDVRLDAEPSPRTG